MFTLVLGGARSGKSTFAVEWGRRREADGADVVFVATARRDDSMSERIARHRRERPEWTTIEEPHDVSGAVAATSPGAAVIVDCMTLWVSNLMARGDDGDSILGAADALAELAATRAGPVLAVSNEVGMGIHPSTELGREYRDVLGLVNQRLAARAEPALLLVAGRALELG